MLCHVPLLGTPHAVVPSHLLLKVKELCGMAGETNQISLTGKFIICSPFLLFTPSVALG